MKPSPLVCANLNFLVAWLLSDTPFAWIFALGGFGCLTAFAMLLAWDVYDMCRKAK